MKTKKIVFLAVLTAISLILFMVENLFPPIFPFAPGVKLGLSNIILLFILIKYDYISALVVLAAKCLVATAFAGFFSLYFSLTCGILSLTLMFLLYKFLFPKIGIVVISISGAILFNICQLLLAAILYNTYPILYYIPIGALISILTGAVVGFALYLIIKYLPENFLTD